MSPSKLLAAVMLFLPLSAFAIGAIAVDDEEGDEEPGYGYVTGYDSKDEARRGALNECKKSGNKNCKVVAWFETCGAYAVSKKYYGVGWGSTKPKAEAMALEKCEGKCRIAISDCE